MKKLDNNIFWPLVIAAAILLVAVMRPKVVSLRDFLEFMVRCTVILLFAVYLFRDVNKYAGLFLMLALFSHSIPGFVLSGYKQLQTDQSYIALNMVVAGCGFYALIVKKCVQYDRILDVLCVIAVLNVLGLICFNKHIGIMANPNESSALLAICSPAFFRGKWLYLLPVVILGLMMSQSYGGIVGLSVAVMIFIAIMLPGLWITLSICVSTLIGMFLFYKYVDHPSIGIRWELWENAIKLSWTNQPYLGFGLGNWAAIYPGLLKSGAFPQGWIRLHNSFVHGFIEMGIGFPILLIGYGTSILKRVSKQAALPLSALGAIGVAMCTNSMFQMNALNGMIAITWLAILEISFRAGQPTGPWPQPPGHGTI